MALSSRGLTYGHQGDSDKAIADYTSVIQMANALAEQKAIASSTGLRSTAIDTRWIGRSPTTLQ